MRKCILSVIGLLFLFAACNDSKQKRKMDAIELSNGLSIKCKALTKAEYDVLTKNVSEPISRLKERYNIDVRQLENHQVAVKEGDYYTLYYSLGDLDKVLLDASGSSGGKEILLNKNPYADVFPSKTDTLIKELLASLKIEQKEPNASLLKVIDDKVNALPNAELFRREHFINFIAVVGEVLIRKHNAMWEMKLSSDGKTWNPYLKIKGKQVQFFTYLYEDVFLNEHKPEQLLTEIYETVNDIERHNL